jgi:hypothetical protein
LLPQFDDAQMVIRQASLICVIAMSGERKLIQVLTPHGLLDASRAFQVARVINGA